MVEIKCFRLVQVDERQCFRLAQVQMKCFRLTVVLVGIKCFL